MNDLHLGWRFDKRISLGHLITTLPLIFIFAAWLMAMDKRIDLNKVQIENHDGDLTRIERNIEGQLSEIKHLIERLDDRVADHQKDEHLKG